MLWMEAVAFQLEGVRGGGWTLGEVGDVSTRARHRSLCERAPALADDRLDLVRGGARVLALDLVRVAARVRVRVRVRERVRVRVGLALALGLG